MDLEEAKATVKALSDQFLPKDRLSRGDRLRPAYGHEKMPAGRRPGLGFGVVRGPAVGNVSSARVLVQIQRSSKAPIAKKFRQLVENWLRESGKLPFDPNDFVFQSVRPLLAFVEPDKQKRSILRAPRFPIGPGAMISVGDDYQGAVGCFARNTAGDLIALSAAHVLRREGRQNPPVLSVWAAVGGRAKPYRFWNRI
ncbi:MAG: hypothetical protein WDN76_08120 [Alphaproteobacteria bacterium]